MATPEVSGCSQAGRPLLRAVRRHAVDESLERAPMRGGCRNSSPWRCHSQGTTDSCAHVRCR